MAKKNTTPTKIYTLEMETYPGFWMTKFCFNARDEADATGKARKWARYHSLNASEVRVHEASEAEAMGGTNNEFVS